MNLKLHKIISKRVCILRCVPDYPVLENYANMNALDEIIKVGFINGYSDHTIGSLSSIISITKGAKIIEKHFT